MDNNGFFYRSNGDFSDSVNEEDEVSALRKRVAYFEGLVEEKDKTIETLRNVIGTLLSSRDKEEASVASSVPQSRPLPEEDKTLNRYVLCSELTKLLFNPDVHAVLNATPKYAYGDKSDKPRVHLVEDNSFLYFDNWGRIHVGAPNKTSKGHLARRVLRQLYKMRDALPSPVIQASLLKSQFNAGIE